MKVFLPHSLKTKIKGFVGAESSGCYTYKICKDEEAKLNGKHILVTGATGAIGFSTVLKLSCQGATVGVGGRDSSKIGDTIKLLKSINTSGRFIPVVIDVTKEEQVKSSIEKFASNNNGRIDALVNNAGGGERERKSELWNLPTEVIKEVLDANLLGAMLCSKYALPFMTPFKSGKIVNLSSVMGMNGKETMTSYSASKAGVIGFTKALAIECGQHSICVNSVAPGMVFQQQLDRKNGVVATQTNCLHRYGFTDEVASLIAFLISTDADYITGQNIAIDGGRSIGLK